MIGVVNWLRRFFGLGLERRHHDPLADFIRGCDAPAIIAPTFKLAPIAPADLRARLETLIMRRYGFHPEAEGMIRFTGRGFTHIKLKTALRFLTAAQLVNCLTDHRPHFFEFLYGQVDLHREGVRLVLDHEGAEWLTLDDSRVERLADDFGHGITSGSSNADMTLGHPQGGSS